MGGVKFGGNCCCLQLQFHPQAGGGSSSSSSPPQTLSIQRRRRRGIEDRMLITYNFVHRSPFIGTNLPRRRSLDDSKRRSDQVLLRRASSASLEDNNNNEEHARLLRDLALNHSQILRQVDSTTTISLSPFSVEPPWPAFEPEQPNWPAIVEMKANSVDLPLSLRIIKRKKKKQRSEEGSTINDSASCCSVRKAFSSMVFIVRELHSYTLQTREVLCYENLQGILARVQGEMNASFVWLFQQIFSCTPTLMVCVMLLLANFTVYSIGLNSSAMAAVVPTTRPVAEIQLEYPQAPVQKNQLLFSTVSIGGGGSGGGKVKPVAGATDDGGRSDGSLSHAITPDEISPVHRGGDKSEAGVVWNRIKEEATRMQASSRDETLMDQDILQQLVSPVKVELELEDHSEYWKTELMYYQALSQDPDNAMVLCNFAQFIYLVLHDHDRAEYYFKRAAEVKPADAEALNRYANFLWYANNDLGAAEEIYLKAIAADPSNSYYASNYAHFLWNTGGEDTCYPLDN